MTYTPRLSHIKVSLISTCIINDLTALRGRERVLQIIASFRHREHCLYAWIFTMYTLVVFQVRTAKPSARGNGKPKAVSGRFTPAIAQPQKHTGNGIRRRSIASASRSELASGGGGGGYRLANGARDGSVTSRIASEDSERPNMSEFPPITTRTTSGRSRRSSKSSGASALPKGAMVAYEKPTLLSVDGHPTEAEVGGASKRTFTSPAPNTASSGNSRRSHSGQSQGVASTGTGNNNNNGRASAAQRLTTHSDKNSLYPTRQRAQKPQSTGAHSAGASVQQQGSLKRAKSFGNFPRQLSVPNGSKARSAKLSTGNRQYTYTKQSAATTRRPERPVQNAHSAENQNGADTPAEVTSDQDVDLEKQDMILKWLTGVDEAERPPSPEFIHHGSPEQSDTAIHVVYDGD